MSYVTIAARREMRRTLSATALSVALALTLATTAGAQGRPGGGRMASTPRFDPATVVTLDGTITKVERLAGQRAGMTGIHLVLTTADGATSSVHLGPTLWVDSQAVKLAQGDQVVVTGSRVSWGGAPVVLAKSVRTARGATLALRDSAGFPLWAGQRMGMRRP